MKNIEKLIDICINKNIYAGPLPEIAVSGEKNLSLFNQYTQPKVASNCSIFLLKLGKV